jgi:hypothetical protein
MIIENASDNVLKPLIVAITTAITGSIPTVVDIVSTTSFPTHVDIVIKVFQLVAFITAITASCFSIYNSIKKNRKKKKK